MVRSGVSAHNDCHNVHNQAKAVNMSEIIEPLAAEAEEADRLTQPPIAESEPLQQRPRVAAAPPRSLPPKSVPPSLNMLADAALRTDRDDHLGFAAYANALAGVLDHPLTDTPFTIAISAPWGAGKTSLANMVASRLVDRPKERGDRAHIVCGFNAWLHDDAPHLGAAFAAEVAKTANKHRAFGRRFFSPLASSMLSPEERWRRRILIGFGSALVAVAIAGVPAVREALKPHSTALDVLKTIGEQWRPLFLFALVALAVWRKVFAAAQSAARFVDDPKSEAATGSMQDVRDQLGKLIRQAVRNPGPLGRWLQRAWPTMAQRFPRLRGRRRLILIVDDLERCRPPRSVEVCEVASQLLGHPDVMTVLVADMSTVAASAEIKYASLEIVPGDPSGGVNGAYGRAYLQKMVQLQFDLPPANLDSVRLLLAADIDTPAEATQPTAGEPGFSWARSLQLTPWNSTFIGLTISTGVTAFTVRLSSRGDSSFLGTSSYWITAVAVATGVVGLIGIIVTFWTANRRRSAAQRIDKEIATQAAASGNLESVYAQVLKSDAGRTGGADLAYQRFERFITDDSELRRQAESEILKYLPDVPRSAKRLANHLRLLLVVATERDMFGGTPQLEAAHLGKWAVLLVRWPELGLALRADPDLMAKLEHAARTSAGIHHLVHAAGTSDLEVHALTEFLTSLPPLAPVVLRLIHCTPAETPTGAV
jgi:hypothetical protein